ncbi:prepilin peptidase [Plantibacter sp. YIM 135347]|uniref:prepilin peptidase n=1 Tax=Plantibacter sp. YIM 135347 TaxID=3423919 RepID=UPI003D35896C
MVGTVRRNGGSGAALGVGGWAVPWGSLAWQVPLGFALVVLSWVVAGTRPVSAALVVIAVITPQLVRIDVREHRLPNRLLLPAIVMAVPSVIVDAFVSDLPVWLPFATGLVWFGVFFLFALAGGLGMGDAKLGLLLGLVAGCFGPSITMLAAMLGVLFGGVGAVVVLVAARVQRCRRRGRWGARRDGRGDARRCATSDGRPFDAGRMAFGPFLLAGFWAAVGVVLLFGRSGPTITVLT